MKGYRFYKEYDSPADKRKDKPNGNVFAACWEGDTRRKYFSYFTSYGEPFIEGYGSIYPEPNSLCMFTSAHLDWLRSYCKHISEAEARQIHPNLFKRIEEC